MASERLSRHIERLLDEADEALTQRRWDVVQERAQDILSIDPENSEGVAFLAAAERALSSSVAATEGSPLARSSATPSAPHSPVQPTSFANGRYEVKRLLGELGMRPLMERVLSRRDILKA